MALFRYELVQEVIDPQLSTARSAGCWCARWPRGSTRARSGSRCGSSRAHHRPVDPGLAGRRVRGAGAPAGPVTARAPAEVLELAAALKRENPARTAAQVARILRAQSGWAPVGPDPAAPLRRLELDGVRAGRAARRDPAVFGRFEADRPNELWVGDALHGPVVAGRKTYLFAFLDDHSRAVIGARFGFAEDTVRLAAALRPALAARGVPESIYVDNGSAFVDCLAAARLREPRDQAGPLHPGPTAGPREDRDGSSAPCASSSSSRSPTSDGLPGRASA